MRIPGLRTAKLAARRVRSRLGGGGVILGYHRIDDTEWDPHALSVSGRNFAAQMEVLRRHAHPVSMADMVAAAGRDELPERAVAVTFDDGYDDMLSEAAPELERFEVPASVFLVTGDLGGEFWWDELARVLSPVRPLPRSLAISIRGTEHTVDLMRPDDTEHRMRLTGALYRMLSLLSPDERGAAIEQLHVAFAVPATEGPSHRCLTADAVRSLACGGLIDIGAHTHTHRPLTTLSPADQDEELRRSKQVAEALLERPVVGFSYPHGSSSEGVARLARRCEFEYACTSFPAAVFRDTDPFLLPRLWVSDLEGPRFRRWLQRWCGR